MEDLKKVQEFFSRPLDEVSNDYSPLSYAKLVANGKMEMEDAMKETGFSYVLLKALVDKVKGAAQNLREEEDPTDIIAMDVPLFIRMLEYAREDAETDMDLHDVTERAIEATKLRGLLSMEDYESIIGKPIEEEEGYSKYLKDDPEYPGGKTPGLTPAVLDKILMKIVQDIDENKLPGLWANIRAKRERGEKPSPKGSKAYKTAVAAGKRINKEK